MRRVTLATAQCLRIFRANYHKTPASVAVQDGVVYRTGFVNTGTALLSLKERVQIRLFLPAPVWAYV